MALRALKVHIFPHFRRKQDREKRRPFPLGENHDQLTRKETYGAYGAYGAHFSACSGASKDKSRVPDAAMTGTSA